MMRDIVRNVGIALLVVCLLLASCGGEVDDEVTELPLTPVVLIPQLNFELDDFIGEKVWTVGFYGNDSFTGDGVAFLVLNFNMLVVNEKLPEHSFARLDGNLPPSDMNSAEILVYGEVKDFAQTYDLFTIEPTPLVTVEEYYILSEPSGVGEWEDSYILSALSSPIELIPTTEAFAAEGTGEGANVKDCDRALIISGGVDASNNHTRYTKDVIAKYKKLKELGFKDDQIAVLYGNGTAINVDGTNITDAKASKQAVNETLEKFKNEMTCCCTLTIFVTDHGTGYNQDQCYHGARPALDPTRESGKTYAENTTVCVNLLKKVYRWAELWTVNGKAFLAIENPITGQVSVYMRQGGTWVLKGFDDDGDGRITEAELDGEDLDGTANTNVGFKVADITSRLRAPLTQQDNEWDTDGDGNIDVKATWNATRARYVLERLKDGVWQEMASDTNGDYIIDKDDGGIDWNLDGDTDDQIGFHEGINLWGWGEVLWDDELADLLKPLHDKGIHILVEMMQCFSGGFVENLKGIVEKIVTAASEDTPSWARKDGHGGYENTFELAFADNLKGIDTKSWNTAFEEGKKADTAKWEAEGSNCITRNEYQSWETTPDASWLDHFKCYLTEGVEFMGEAVYLEDQWGGVEAMVGWDWFFCNPVEMWHDEVLTPISHRDHHLTLYGLDYEEEPQTWFVTVDNQFGIQELTVYGPIKLGVPTQKVEPGAHDPPVCLDHFLFYKVVEGPSVDVVVGLYDQFHDEPEVLVTQPVFFANPVRKTHGGIVTEIKNPAAHLVVYEILGGEVYYPHVQVVNQFGEQTFDVSDPAHLAVPSEKLSCGPLPPQL
jgi:hypothetical protein